MMGCNWKQSWLIKQTYTYYKQIDANDKRRKNPRSDWDAVILGMGLVAWLLFIVVLAQFIELPIKFLACSGGSWRDRWGFWVGNWEEVWWGMIT